MTDSDSERGPRDERQPGDERDERDPREPGDPRDERDERLPGEPADSLNGRTWQWLGGHPVMAAVALSSLVAGVGYFRTEQIRQDNRKDQVEACEQRNMAWERTIDFVEELSDNPDFIGQLDRLRDVGIVDC